MQSYYVEVFDIGFSKKKSDDGMLKGKYIKTRANSINNLRKNLIDKYFDLGKQKILMVYKLKEDGTHDENPNGVLLLNFKGAFWGVKPGQPHKVSLKTGRLIEGD